MADNIETKQQDDNGINVQDLILMSNVIRVSQSRGAFRAEEMELIGKLFSRLENFLKTNVPDYGKPKKTETPTTSHPDDLTKEDSEQTSTTSE